jgi:membrane-bound lytic murein transglycosylase D
MILLKNKAVKILCMIILFQSGGICKSDIFSVPKGLEMRVQFWVNVFTKYSMDQAVIMDGDYPERIYQVVDLRSYFPNRYPTKAEKIRILRREKNEIISILRKLGNSNIQMSELSKKECRIVRLFGKEYNKHTFRKASRRVHIQRGMKEAFKEGIVRSGRYIAEIRKIFKKEGLPVDLVFLPHIESSFNPLACSRIGATGIWQFTRSTGKIYMQIDGQLDERKDPFISSKAAAKLLKMNYKILGNWPLAVTAYNHGPSGINRAVRKLKTRNLVQIIKKYKSRSFGFASKNFYAEFLAAVQIARNPAICFGDIVMDEPINFRQAHLSEEMKLDEIEKTFQVTKSDIIFLNPAIAKSIKTSVAVQDWLLNIDHQIEVINDIVLQKNSGYSEIENHVMQNNSQSQIVSTNIDQRIMKIDIGLKVSNEKIKIYPGETLGHYADWLEINTHRLRKINGLL